MTNDGAQSSGTACIELHYLPCLRYFSLFFSYERLLIEACETYQKRSYRNRCHIGGANGVMRLSIPLVSGKHSGQAIRDVRMSNHQDWRRAHWHSIVSAYGKTPFFFHYAPELESLIMTPGDSFFSHSLTLLKWCMHQLGLSDSRLELTRHYAAELSESMEDWRHRIVPSGKDGKYSHNEKGRYLQPFSDRHGFIPNLSIIDLLFCAGPEASAILQKMVAGGEYKPD
jgi:hypothetical protein